MEDQTINIRLTAVEARLAAIEGRLAEQSATIAKRKRRELSPEERSAIRQRLVAGQKAKRERELTEAAAEANKATDQKGK
jgi:uncharacterized coiled-coil protein SlyX